MILTVNSESAAFVRVNLAPIKDKSLQLKNHPNINKQVLSSENALCHKDASKSFPVGTPLPILKWKSGASADHFVPIKVVRARLSHARGRCSSRQTSHCAVLLAQHELQLLHNDNRVRPSTSTPVKQLDIPNCSTRYELVKDDVSVQSFCLVIPVSGKPKIASCDYGTTQYDSGAATVGGGAAVWRNRVCLTFLQLAWLVDSISADNQTGSLEFSTPPVDADSFFPIEVHFR